MAYPPGGTFFDGKRSFADVPLDAGNDNAISTTEFLEASEALTLLFDVLGGAAFKPVKSDMTGNITVSRDQQYNSHTGIAWQGRCVTQVVY